MVDFGLLPVEYGFQGDSKSSHAKTFSRKLCLLSPQCISKSLYDKVNINGDGDQHNLVV